MRGGDGAVTTASRTGAAVGANGVEEIQFEWVSGMNCTEFEQVVVEMARRELMEAAPQHEALAHAKTCVRCGRRLANEQRLSGVVAAALVEDSQRIAPAAVEQMLIAAFQKQHAGSKRQRTWWARAALGALAAALIVAAAVGLRRTPDQQTVRTMTKPAEVHVTPPASPVIAPVVREVAKAHVRTLRKASRKSTNKPAVAEHEVMTEFIPILYDLEPIERGQIVRIRLPLAALASFGFPVNEEHADEPIRADVVLGEDGLARAVRFVK
jgi:hypothetical protein